MTLSVIILPIPPLYKVHVVSESPQVTPEITWNYSFSPVCRAYAGYYG